MLNVRSALLQAALIFPAVHISYLANPGSSLFSWHPTLMILGFFTLLNEGIIVFSPKWSPTAGKFRGWNLVIHIILMNLAAVGIVGGFLAIYNNKNENDKPHFVSWHGFIGLVTLLVAALQAVLGALANYGIYIKFLRPTNKFFRLAHVLTGVVCLVFVSVSLMLALYTNWFTHSVSSLVFYVYAAVFAVAQTTVIARTLKENKKLACYLS